MKAVDKNSQCHLKKGKKKKHGREKIYEGKVINGLEMTHKIIF